MQRTSLQDLNDSYGWPCDESRMYRTQLFPERADGLFIWMEGDPTPYLDLVLGYSSVNFGHCHQVIRDAVSSEVRRIDQVHAFHSQPQLELSRLLVDQLAADQHYKVYLDVGGSSVIAAALRICRTHTGRTKMIAFDGAFHGVSDAGAAISDDRLLNRAHYGPEHADRFQVLRLPFADSIKGPGAEVCLRLLDSALSANDVAGIVLEPVQGAGGFNIPADGFLSGVQQLARRYRVPVVFDEIQSGLGRCGSFFAYQRWTTQPPDIVVLAKSLAGGYYPLSGLIAKTDLLSALPLSGTSFQSTFNNNPFGCAIALRTLQYGLSEGIFANADAKGTAFRPLIEVACSSPHISNLRAIGMAFAFDITLGDAPAPQLAQAFVEQALAHHILLYCSGVAKNVIKLAPPLTSTLAELEMIAGHLKNLVQTFEASLS